VTAALIAWLCLPTLLASWLFSLAIATPVWCFIRRTVGPFRSVSDAADSAPMLVSLLVHTGAATILAVSVSLRAAIIVISVAGLVWGLSSYFLQQRFADPWDRPGVVLITPLLLPLVSFAFFVSSVLALSFFTAWYWGVLPLVIWVILGFATAEIAIRRYMSRSRESGRDCDRRFAISAINFQQGRIDFLGADRYPFP